MSKYSFKPNRATRAARRRNGRLQQHRIRWPFSIHAKAIELLYDQIRKGTGLLCLFHGGAQWVGLKSLLVGNNGAEIRLESSLRLSDRRWIPDLTVRCQDTGALLLVIEVWHTHAVSATKRRSYLDAKIPWIEVKAWNVIYRVGKKALSILDWGGIAEIDSPCQRELFQVEVPKSETRRESPRMAFDLRRNDWPLPAPSQRFTSHLFANSST
jgi:hypothetical protein